MRIHGLTVCVNKADHLAKCIGRWLHRDGVYGSGLASLTIVSDLRGDGDKFRAVEKAGAILQVVKTDAFTRDGAAFNKGRAMEEARLKMPWEDWILFLDCDVVPPTDWKARVKAANPEPGHLYGCWRFQAPDEGPYDDVGQPRIPTDGIGVGFFQLFHSSDYGALGMHAGLAVDASSEWPDFLPDNRIMPSASSRFSGPLIETHWIHGGNYDNRFMDRWRPPLRDKDYRVLIPSFRLAHLGERDGWFGRGKKAEFDAMQVERKRRGGTWDHERIQVETQPQSERART